MTGTQLFILLAFYRRNEEEIHAISSTNHEVFLRDTIFLKDNGLLEGGLLKGFEITVKAKDLLDNIMDATYNYFTKTEDV